MTPTHHTRRAWPFYEAHAPDFATLAGPVETLPAETPVEVHHTSGPDRAVVRAERCGRTVWSYIFASDLEHIQQELAQ